MSQSHGMMTKDADGRMKACAFAILGNALRGTPDESAFVHLTSADGNTMVGVWHCGAYVERLIDYPHNEMRTVIEGAVEITADGDDRVTYCVGDTFFMAKGFTGLWESHARFRKYFMVSLG